MFKAGFCAGLVLVVLAGFAFAAPSRIEDCEQVRGADAYNYCLASFGPKRGVHRGGGAARTYARHPGRKLAAGPALGKRDASGRITVLFDVGSRRRNR